VSNRGTLRVVIAVTVCIVAPSADAAPRARTAPAFPFGTWENAKHTVRVRIERCGGLACGRVVWASAKAKADARKGGTDNLVGVQLFRDLAPGDDGVWSGKIFVPDLNGTFDGTVRADGPAGLTAQGCVAKLVCKSQAWTRRGR
jgi:uncharacterized protein (DUF2147 family)